jgi:hypothetical protein
LALKEKFKFAMEIEARCDDYTYGQILKEIAMLQRKEERITKNIGYIPNQF